jgi:hypothetical protein
VLRKIVLSGLLIALALPAAAAAHEKVSRSDRAAINQTLDAFVLDGVKREHPLAARAYVTGDMARGSRAAWKRGDTSIYPYQARGKTFHGWTFSYRSRNAIGIDLLLRPVRRLRKKIGPILFHVDLKRHGNRWLVSNFQPGAVYTPAGVHPDMMASNDLQPGTGGPGVNTGKPKLGAIWMLVPVGLLGGGLVLGFGILLFRWYEGRRLARTY